MFVRIAVLALAVAACKTSPPASSTPPRDSGRDAPVVAADATAAVVIDAAPPLTTPDAGPKKGTAMTPEAILDEHYAKDSRGKPVNLRPTPHVPGLFHAEWSNAAEYVLVHDGALVTTKGVDAMGAWMKDVDLLSQQALDADDLIKLLHFFNAWASQYLADGYYVYDKFKDLKPKLERTNGGAKLTLSYLQQSSSGSRANANLRKVARATLAIPSDYQLAWSSETIDFDISQP